MSLQRGPINVWSKDIQVISSASCLHCSAAHLENYTHFLYSLAGQIIPATHYVSYQTKKILFSALFLNLKLAVRESSNFSVFKSCIFHLNVFEHHSKSSNWPQLHSLRKNWLAGAFQLSLGYRIYLRFIRLVGLQQEFLLQENVGSDFSWYDYNFSFFEING